MNDEIDDDEDGLEPDEATEAGAAGEPSEATGPFKSGFIGLAGVPNAGKSTLMNRLVGQKVSIMSRSPQTTRHRVCGILNDPGLQAIFVDVPGIIREPGTFNANLTHCAEDALRDCDMILHLRDAALAESPDEMRVVEVLSGLSSLPIWQVWNKIDRKQAIPERLALNPPLPYEKTFLVSARTGVGIDTLKGAIREQLPEGPPLYPEDEISDRDMRFICAELVREKLFRNLHEEVPYGIATWTEDWNEREGQPTFIRVVIQTERANHKGIILGEKGMMLKRIGQEARADIEKLTGEKVYLELWVQVRPGWRRNPAELERLGLKQGR